MQKIDTIKVLEGTSLSPGLAEGTIHVHREWVGSIDTATVNNKCHEPGKELEHLDLATTKITEDLVVLARKVEAEIGSGRSKVFEAHRLMLNDLFLKEELRREIVDNLVSASSAVKNVLLRWERRFLSMESHVARTKSDDIRDISIRLRNALAGINVHPMANIPNGCILATSRLLPSDTVFLGNGNTVAVLLEFGSIGSHAALFAREMGLPCITGIANIQRTIPDAATALVNADTGTVAIHPNKNQVIAFQKNIRCKAQAFKVARTRALEPAITQDGTKITVLANVGCEEDTEKAMYNGAEGVGLYRMEWTYLRNVNPPSVDELISEMRRTLEPAKGRMVCVRLLDVGGDKPISFLKIMSEANPSLGRRGIRLLREYPELLMTHLRAVLELAKDFEVCVLVPMVTLVDDVAMVRHHLNDLGSQLSLPSLPKLGAMIETPAAALSTREIAKHVDFLSFGTNDLTQYAFAADRENAAVERYFNDTSEVIFRMLRIAHHDVPNMPLSICGELAGRPQFISRLLHCGIRTFSVAPPLVPAIKEAIRNATLSESREHQPRAASNTNGFARPAVSV